MAPHGAAPKYHQNMEKIIPMSLDKGTCPITQSALPGEKGKKCNPSGGLEKKPMVIGGWCGAPTNNNWIGLTN